MTESAWRCPVCDTTSYRPRWRVTSTATENGVDPDAFRPSTDRYGATVGTVVRCLTCRHGSLLDAPTEEQLAAAYDAAEDDRTLVEEAGHIATASRDLALVEQWSPPGRLVDIGCWTGSFLAAAAMRGWATTGLEPSRWAAERARARGLDVSIGDLQHNTLPHGAHDVVVMCDVLEHLLDPAAALRQASDLLTSRGVLYVTVPDAGSAVARLMGRRWWSVLPMHVQYFSRASMHQLLSEAGFQPLLTRTHPKVFTAGYYAERLGGYSTAIAGAVSGGLRAARLSERPIAPNFRDRMQVLAQRR